MRLSELRTFGSRAGIWRTVGSRSRPQLGTVSPFLARPQPFHSSSVFLRKSSKTPKYKAKYGPVPLPPAPKEEPFNSDPVGSATRKELMEMYKTNPFVVLDFQDPDTPDGGMKFASKENLLLDAEREDRAPGDEFDYNPASGRHTFLQRGDLVQLM